LPMDFLVVDIQREHFERPSKGPLPSLQGRSDQLWIQSNRSRTRPLAKLDPFTADSFAELRRAILQPRRLGRDQLDDVLADYGLRLTRW
jgi:hypothetical protein